jgi:hypothetical protein
MNSVSRHNRFVERQSRLRAIPANEFVNGVPIAPLRLRRTQTVQDGSLRVIEVRKSELRPGQGFLLGMCILASRHWAAASLPPTTRSPRHRSNGRVTRLDGTWSSFEPRRDTFIWSSMSLAARRQTRPLRNLARIEAVGEVFKAPDSAWIGSWPSLVSKIEFTSVLSVKLARSHVKKKER